MKSKKPEIEKLNQETAGSNIRQRLSQKLSMALEGSELLTTNQLKTIFALTLIVVELARSSYIHQTELEIGIENPQAIIAAAIFFLGNLGINYVINKRAKRGNKIFDFKMLWVLGNVTVTQLPFEYVGVLAKHFPDQKVEHFFTSPAMLATVLFTLFQFSSYVTSYTLGRKERRDILTRKNTGKNKS